MAKKSKRSKRKNKQNKIYLGILLSVSLIVILIAVFGNSADQVVGDLPLVISVEEAYNYREAGAFILDVRTQEEWDAGHIPGSTLIPLDELPNRLGEVPGDIDVVVVCRSGNRSATARDILLNAEFTSVTSIDGGVNQWADAGFPIE
ncbi:MAG: rhodanese-like domain-containing protein [Chloroflexota bacterium]